MQQGESYDRFFRSVFPAAGFRPEAGQAPDAMRTTWLSRAARRLVQLGNLCSIFLFGLLPRRRRHIGVVRIDGIGDFILWLEGARAIRARYQRPEYHVSLIASSKWSDFAKSSAVFDDVIVVDAVRFLKENRYRWATCYRIAKRRFSVAINPTFSRSVWIDDLIVRATSASIRIGHVGDLSNATSETKRIADTWYTDLVPVPKEAVHELSKNWHFAKQFDPQIVLRSPQLEPRMISRPRWMTDDSGHFVLFPSSGRPIRIWPVERLGEIAARINAKTNWRGIVCGLPTDSEAAQKLITQAHGVPIEDACGKTTLPELAGIIAEAKLIVTNDTSAAHLAAALGVPAVVILGGGHFGRFLPYPPQCEPVNGHLHAVYHPMPCYECNWRCIYTRSPDDPGACIASVTIEDVWSQVEPLIDRH